MPFQRRTLRRKPQLRRLRKMVHKIEGIERESIAFMRASEHDRKVKLAVVTEDGKRYGPDNAALDLLVREKGGITDGD